MSQRITKRLVDQLQPSHKDEIAWDNEIKGFGVRCRPSGAKFYVLKTRIRHRQRWFTIGRHGSPWTPDMARDEARRLLGLKADRKDPAAERDEDRKAETVRELAKVFMDKHVPTTKPRTQESYKHIINKLIVPALGHFRIPDVQRSDVEEFRDSLSDRPYQANRALAVLSKLMNFAESKGLRPGYSNPCRHVERNKERERERFLNDQELKRLQDVLTKEAAEGTADPYFVAAIRLLILTGARLSEITTLQWSHLDESKRILTLPDSKTGPKVIPLNDRAFDVIQSIRKVENNPYIIVGRNEGQHLVEMQKPWRRIRKRAGLDNVRIHDLRHSFASKAAATGMSLLMIGKLLGHKHVQTTQRYAKLSVGEMQAASNRVGTAMSAAMAPASQNAPGPKRRRVRL